MKNLRIRLFSYILFVSPIIALSDFSINNSFGVGYDSNPLRLSNNEINQITYTKDKSQQSILNIGGDEILSYEMILKSLLFKRKIKKSIFTINSHFFLLFLSPLLIINSRLYSEILRIKSDLSGFQKSNIYLKIPPKKFIDLV